MGEKIIMIKLSTFHYTITSKDLIQIHPILRNPHCFLETKESRIGKKEILIPDNVKINLNQGHLIAEGPKGKRSLDINPALSVLIEKNKIKVLRKDDERRTYEIHALNRTLLNNLIIGVSQGFEKKLSLVGVGFKAKVQNYCLTLSVGFSHDVTVQLPDSILVDVTNNVNLCVSGNDKNDVGSFAANLRRIRPPEPYGGKGIRYDEETIVIKEGKSAKKIIKSIWSKILN